jgi:hypothetical protein
LHRMNLKTLEALLAVHEAAARDPA